MKRNYLNILLVSGLFLMGTLASCTKEGPAGPAGADGTNGTNGTNGTDGTTTCVQCHSNNEVLFAKEIQWAESVHGSGSNFERNDAACAACHTSQGFLQRMANGTQEADGKVNNPTPVDCYTCHQIHSTYTTEDLTLTYTAPVTLWISGTTFDMGQGNLCANCHQPLKPNPLPVPGGANVAIGSPYWGAHHGTQGAILSGAGGYEVGSGYTNSAHTTLVTDGCVTCHMANPYGVQAGGHTMNMTYAYHGSDAVYTGGCIACHTDDAALHTKIDNTQEEIEGLLTELGTILATQGVLNPTTLQVVPGDLTANQAGGVMNFNMVREDGSLGVHNYAYAKKLLQNSIASLQ